MSLYIGSFSFQRQFSASVQDGEFQILASADDFKEALEEFRTHIDHTRKNSTLLSGKVRVVLDRVLELPVPSSETVMLNFQYQTSIGRGPLVVQPIPEDDDSASVFLYSFHKKAAFLEQMDGADSEFVSYQD